MYINDTLYFCKKILTPGSKCVYGRDATERAKKHPNFKHTYIHNYVDF